MYTKPSQSEELNEVLVHSSKFQLSTPTIQSIHMQKCHNLSGIHKHAYVLNSSGRSATH